jgi:polar amino acid transport system substrate-binding protein
MASALFACVFWSTLSCAVSPDEVKKRGVLRVCAEAGYLPMEMKNTHNEWFGFDVEMSQAFAKSLGVKLEMLDTKWDGIIPSLLTNRCDMIASSMSVNEERSKVVDFSAPYYDNNMLIGVKDSKENREKFKTIKDFNNPDVTLAVKTGSAPDLYLRDSNVFPQAKVLRFDADADTVNAVLHRGITAFVYDTPYVTLAALNNPGKIFIAPVKLKGDQFAVAFSKQAKALRESFNNFLIEWKTSGGYEKAKHYYFDSLDWQKNLDSNTAP